MSDLGSKDNFAIAYQGPPDRYIHAHCFCWHRISYRSLYGDVFDYDSYYKKWDFSGEFSLSYAIQELKKQHDLAYEEIKNKPEPPSVGNYCDAYDKSLSSDECLDLWVKEQTNQYKKSIIIFKYSHVEKFKEAFLNHPDIPDSMKLTP